MLEELPKTIGLTCCVVQKRHSRKLRDMNDNPSLREHQLKTKGGKPVGNALPGMLGCLARVCTSKELFVVQWKLDRPTC